jgi:hypothetical protein
VSRNHSFPAHKGMSVFAAVGIAMLSACATVNTPDQPTGGKVVSTEVPLSTFKLAEFTATWRANEPLAIEMRCSWMPYTFSRYCPTDIASSERARHDVDQMNSVLETHAVAQLKSRLAHRGLREGAGSHIELRPQSAYWSAAGWGSGVLVEVVVADAKSGQKWTFLVPADTGIQMLSAWAAGPQTIDYAAAFAARLDGVLASAGMFK